MRKLVPGVLTIAMSLGLVACGGDEEQAAQDQTSPTVEEEAGVVPSQEENQPSAVPGEPIDPTGTTPSEPPDAGEHGITGGGDPTPGNETSGDGLPSERFTPPGGQPETGGTVEGTDETVPAEPPQ